MCICSSLHWRPTLGNRLDNHLMSNDIVCFDKTFIFTSTHGVDISGLDVLTVFTANYCTWRLQSWKYLNTFISIQFGQNFDASNCETFKRERAVGMLEAGASTEDVAAKLDHLCRQLEVWDGGLCRPEARTIFHVAVDHVLPRRRKTAIFWTNIYEIVF